MLFEFPAPFYSPDGGGVGGTPSPGGGAPSPAAGGGAPATPARPEWLPEAHWDTTTNAIKPEFGAHYTELATFHKTETDRSAALKARKPEEITVALPAEFKIPDGLKGPDGKPLTLEQVKIDEKHPLVAPTRALAHKYGIPQEVVSELAGAFVQMQLDD